MWYNSNVQAIYPIRRFFVLHGPQRLRELPEHQLPPARGDHLLRAITMYAGYTIYIRFCAICGDKFVTDRPKIEKVCIKARCYLEYQNRPKDEPLPSTDYPIEYKPKAIRPKGVYAKTKDWGIRYIPPNVRLDVEFRDNGICQYCGGGAECIDHIVPVSKGGSSKTAANLVQACTNCNSVFSDKLFESFKEKRAWMKQKIMVSRLQAELYQG